MIDRRRRNPRNASRRGSAGASSNAPVPGVRGPSQRPVVVRAQSRIEPVTIDAIAAGGDGVGRVDGMAAFIPRTAPGDEIEASLVSHGRFSRGHITRIVTPSPLRADPQCKHYTEDECGGCQIQHLTAGAQRDAKARIVRDTLSRIGKREIEMPEVAASPKQWDYRQKLTLSLVRNSATRQWTGGLHPLGQADTVFPLEECRISDPALVSAWHGVRAQSTYLPEASALRLTFRLIPDSDRVALTVAGGFQWKNWRDFARNIPALGALWWISSGNHRTELIAPSNSEQHTAVNFVQVNAGMAAQMHQHVLNKVMEFKPSHIIDAYAGTGDLSIAVTKQGVSSTAIEWDHAAVALMREQMPEGSAALAAPVEEVIERAMYHPSRPDVVVLNPPREGIDAFVSTTLEENAAKGVRALVYVSCDPATLARDLKRMPSWRIASVRCFDMFPQTAHVETVCVLIPEAA